MYLTGAILPADRAVVVRHLAACAACRAELADLAGLPGLLRRPASRAAAEAPGPEPSPGREPAPAAGVPAGAQLSRLLGNLARRRRRRRWLLALAVCALVAVAAMGWALRLAEPPGPRAETATVLETGRVGGVTVLTDAEGYTLYWFGPDNATMSACTASCATAWPPVTAPVVVGAGVTGAIGAIARPDGSLQATYDGHPLYTASADKAPGQARGNGVWSSGGEWHEVAMGGGQAPATPAPTDRYGGGY